MNKYIEDLDEMFCLVANEKQAIEAAAYMKNQFSFYGIYMNERRKISTHYIKEQKQLSQKELYDLVKKMWLHDKREFQYIAVELIAFYKKIWQEDLIDLIEFLITHKSWWDSVDHIGSYLLTDYFNKFPHKTTTVTSIWNKSENIWLKRSSIMFQKKLKQNTNVDLLSKYILACSDSKEFFIQKAIGWSLREYAKTNPTWVLNFVNTHQLPPLSKREALKHL